MAERDWLEWHGYYDQPGSSLRRRLLVAAAASRGGDKPRWTRSAAKGYTPAAGLRTVEIDAGQSGSLEVVRAVRDQDQARAHHMGADA